MDMEQTGNEECGEKENNRATGDGLYSSSQGAWIFRNKLYMNLKNIDHL